MKLENEKSLIYKILISTLISEGLNIHEQSSPEEIIKELLGKSCSCQVCNSNEGLRLYGKSARKIQRVYCRFCTIANEGKRRPFLETKGTLTFYVQNREKLLEALWLFIHDSTLSVEEIANTLGISIYTAFVFRQKIGLALKDHPDLQSKIRNISSIEVQLPHMEKGNSDRNTVKTKYLNEDLKLETNNLETKGTIPIHLKDTYTTLLLTQDETGSVAAKILSSTQKEAKSCESIASQRAFNTYLVDLFSFLAGPFRGVSSRYISTYICLHQLHTRKYSFLSLMRWAISDRKTWSSYRRTKTEDVWNLPTVQFSTASA